jgi:hypothetical protein
MEDKYIYDLGGMTFPYDRYENHRQYIQEANKNGMFFYKQRIVEAQDGKIKRDQIVEASKMPGEAPVIDIYNNPEYHDVDTDEEIDMDEVLPKSRSKKQIKEEETQKDLLKHLTEYLERITKASNTPSSIPVSVSTTQHKNKSTTKKQKRSRGKQTKRVRRAHPKKTY